MRSYDNLVEALQELKKEGYTYDFNLLDNGSSLSDELIEKLKIQRP